MIKTNREARKMYEKHLKQLDDMADMKTDEFLSWDDVVKFSIELNVPTAQVMFRGVFNSKEEI